MTELRKRILDSIYKRESKKIETKITLENEKVSVLESKKEMLKKQLDTSSKYHIYSHDTYILDEFADFKEQYKLLRIDRQNYLRVNFLFLLTSVVASRFSLEGHYTLYLIDYFKRSLNLYNGYDVKKYRLVKKNIREYLHAYNIEKQYYNLEAIVDSFNNSISYINDEIRTCDKKENELILLLKQLKIQLYKGKINYINGKLKLEFKSSSTKNYYDTLKISSELKPFLNTAKVKTLKKTITIK